MTIGVKNFILIAGVLAIAAIIGIYIPYLRYQQRQKIQNSESAPANTDLGAIATVRYTNKGFEPDIVTVKVGATVEWINESDKLMWVASDPHPSHTDLPGFDERGVESGDGATREFLPRARAHTVGAIYKYTFQKIGKWGYHNHLVPFDRGTIIVK